MKLKNTIHIFLLAWVMVVGFTLAVPVEVYSAITGTVNVRIEDKKDDAEEKKSDGKVTDDSSDLELGFEGSEAKIVGLRFPNIQIPRGATITRAYIQFYCDEVTTGLGRTGKWFAYQHFDITPDIMTLAKALGGGVAIGAMMAKDEVAASLVPGKHATTFGGSALVCAAGIAVIEAIEEDNLLENAVEMGQYTKEKLNQLKQKHSIIDHVRSVGLMIGVQLSSPGSEIVDKCLENGLRINCTQGTVLRFMPPMIVNESQIDKAVDILDNVLTENVK